MQDETFEKVAFLFLGWLLGLLSPIIVDAIRRRRENALGRDAIKTKLSRIKVTLALANHAIEKHQGTMTRQSLQQLVNILGLANDDTDALSSITGIKQLLELPDGLLDRYIRSKKSPGGISLTLQKYGTPLLDARVSALWSFDTEIQRVLLELKNAFDIASEIVDRARHFSNLTFQKLENGNHALAVDNVEGCYTQYAGQVKRIIATIEKFENLS